MTELSPESARRFNRLEEEQGERYRPKLPQERQTPAEAFAKRLAVARSETMSVVSRVASLTARKSRQSVERAAE